MPVDNPGLRLVDAQPAKLQLSDDELVENYALQAIRALRIARQLRGAGHIDAQQYREFAGLARLQIHLAFHLLDAG